MIYSHPGEIPGLSPSTSVRQVGGNGGEAQAPTGMFSRNASARRSVGARSDGLGDSYVHGSDLRYIEQEKREAEFHPLSQPGPNSAPGSALTTHRHLTHLPNAPEGTVAPPEFDPGYRLQSFNDGEEKGAAEQLSLVGGDARYAAALNQVIRNQATDLFEARFAKLEAENQQLKKELQQLKAKQSSCWPSWFRCGKAQ
jgi:hypothetical protein